MAEKTTEQLEKACLKQIQRTYKDVLERNEQKAYADNLARTAAFDIVQITKLKDYIRENGWSDYYQNGDNQMGKKQSVEATAYFQLSKDLKSTIRQLTDMLPKNCVEERDELDAFIESRLNARSDE